MNRSESKYFNTAIRMDEAMMELLERKDFEYITIKEICAAAGVSRSTFYLHYENLSQLLDEAVALMHDRFMDYFDEESESFIESLSSCDIEKMLLVTPEYLTKYLSFIYDHRKLYGAAMRNPVHFRTNDTYAKLFKHIFDPILERFSVPEAERQYIMAFHLSGISAIVGQWIDEDCATPIDTIMRIIMQCTSRPELK